MRSRANQARAQGRKSGNECRKCTQRGLAAGARARGGRDVLHANVGGPKEPGCHLPQARRCTRRIGWFVASALSLRCTQSCTATQGRTEQGCAQQIQKHGLESRLRTHSAHCDPAVDATVCSELRRKHVCTLRPVLLSIAACCPLPLSPLPGQPPLQVLPGSRASLGGVSSWQMHRRPMLYAGLNALSRRETQAAAPTWLRRHRDDWNVDGKRRLFAHGERRGGQRSL